MILSETQRIPCSELTKNLGAGVTVETLIGSRIAWEL